jgi:hypothetical protein
MAIATPELFANGKCGTPLPAGEVLQVFRFGQFCPMKVLDDSAEAIVVVGKTRQSTDGNSPASTTTGVSSVLRARATNSDGHGTERGAAEFTFSQLLSSDLSLEKPIATPVIIPRERVAQVVASAHVEHQGRSWALTLTPAAVKALLNGQSTELEARFEGAHQLLLLKPEDGLVRQPPVRPSVTEFEIPEAELPGFLANPWLPDEDGLPGDLMLEDANVEELVRDGSTIVKVGDREIKIKVTPYPLDRKVTPVQEDRQPLKWDPLGLPPRLPEELPGSEGGTGHRGWGDDRAQVALNMQPRRPEEPLDSEGGTGGQGSGPAGGGPKRPEEQPKGPPSPGGGTTSQLPGPISVRLPSGSANWSYEQEVALGTGATVTTPGKYQPRQPLRAGDLQGIALVVYFEWKQEWVLKGFSRGRLLHSLSLAPQEEATIELFTWDRRKRSLEQSSLTETEQSVEDEEKTQDTTEVFRELTKKDEFQWKVGGDLDAQYNGVAVNVKLKTHAEAQDKTNAEDVAKNTTKTLREGVQKAAAKVKTQRSSKISETTEMGLEERVTRKVRNPNLCHTLNLDYFEVSTHYEITTSFNEDGMRFCAAIPNPIARDTFPPEFVRQNEGALRDMILDRGLVSGFDGLRLLRAREVALKDLEEKRDRRKMDLVQSAPGPEKKPDTTTALSAEESAANNYLINLQGACQKILTESLIGGLRNALRSLAGPSLLDPQSDLQTKKGVPRTIDLDQGKRWLAQQLFLRHYSQLSQVLGDLAAASGALSMREWGPKLAPVMPSASAMPRPSQLGLEPQEAKEGLMVEMVRPHVMAPWDWGWWWSEIRRVGLHEPDDAGLGATVEQFEKVYRAFLESESRKSAATSGQAAIQQAQATQDQLSDEDRLEADFPLRDYAMATERAEVLRDHLAEHKHHYSFALFRALPPQEQIEHIERAMAGIDTGFDPGFFEPRTVSQIGSLLLVPLNHEVIPKAKELLDILKERIEVEPTTDTVLLPTPGMTTEVRLGNCSACEEFIEESRKLDLDLRHEQLRQAKAEADRLERRLEVEPPELDDPKPQIPRVQVDLEESPARPT